MTQGGIILPYSFPILKFATGQIVPSVPNRSIDVDVFSKARLVNWKDCWNAGGVSMDVQEIIAELRNETERLNQAIAALEGRELQTRNNEKPSAYQNSHGR
jgi:hypothetical protein